MYELKPILHPVQIELPKCMYHMKGVYSDASTCAAVSPGQRSITPLDISQQIRNILMVLINQTKIKMSETFRIIRVVPNLKQFLATFD